MLTFDTINDILELTNQRKEVLKMLKIINYMDVENNGLLDNYDEFHTEYLDNTDTRGVDFDTQEMKASDYAIAQCDEVFQERKSTQIMNLLEKHDYSMFTLLTVETQFINNELTKDELRVVMKEFAYAMEQSNEQMTKDELKTFEDEMTEQLD